MQQPAPTRDGQGNAVPSPLIKAATAPTLLLPSSPHPTSVRAASKLDAVRTAITEDPATLEVRHSCHHTIVLQ